MTNAEMAVPSNYAESDTVVFNRRYKTLGVVKGDEREVAKVDRERNTVHLRDREGHVVEWPALHCRCPQGRCGGVPERENGAPRRRPRALYAQ